MKLSQNLAATPFKNQRVPGVLIGLLGLALVLLSVAHLFSLSRVMPQRTSALQQDSDRLSDEAARLRRELAKAPAETVDEATAARWAALKNVVDRRVFDWTALLAKLEEALPQGVRLNVIQPEVKGGRVVLTLDGSGRSLEDVEAFGRNLEAQPAFISPTPVDFATTEAAQTFTYRVEYRPAAATVR